MTGETTHEQDRIHTRLLLALSLSCLVLKSAKATPAPNL